MDEENSNTPRTQDDSLLAAIEGNLSGMKHSDLVLTCEMLTRGRAVWRKEAEELRRQNERLVEALNGLRLAVKNDGVAVEFNNELSRTALHEALRRATKALSAQPEEKMK